ncbi:bifunctional 4-hydroxy-2-oxoglutarate aldolase/2-dehydro-3-deoxy-phosphogluconate aldolase [Bacillus sp. SD088]|uniref:bifunctional 4-hydroxy-2-oxoglutarate aldolase/2-dehydro-3-deoxy-phosphogluconate aldolase n=1 Tax=Bacillus sp. SD088 TaxID=2782012 RepID=UPI001A95E253|nr:bifunctional 4-hydroxy-2-oxoglutarate aldolase/2-dehydro-3-deoxy-phosphogluconate aldolase [Bacillus sp. SD088]MBO0994446.1 bifunctional 4-hydroxy-2-oxoglutarate aldolase/2-dehydro-3-deoxy-phosphogluconate aldolase [Bacillus sp. SD088]
MDSVLQAINEHKIISIIRADADADLQQVIDSLYAGGVRILEITMNTPGALDAIKTVKQRYPDILVGAGTVLDSETVRLAILAGASFLLAPTLNEAAIITANRYNVPIIPGVLTPTEVVRASELGAKVVKIFPVSTLGPTYIKDLKGPLAQIEMIPVGGVTTDTAIDFLEAGSFALGVGSPIVDKNLVKQKNFAEIQRRAEEMVKIVGGYNR